MPYSQSDGNPLVVTFVDKRYIPVLANWLAFACRVGNFDICIYCLDRETEDFAKAAGLGVESVNWDGSFENLWALRLRILADLVEEGRSIVHTDSDCIWLADPLLNGFGSGADLIFSQGTIHPASVHEKLGFVLCCGLFRVNPGAGGSQFLRKLAEHVEHTKDDQASVNELLLSAETVWDRSDTPDYRLRFRNSTFPCWTETLRGVCTREQITIDLVPHKLVQRIPDPTALEREVIAKHHFSAKDAKAKLDEFRKQGLYALVQNWDKLEPGALLEDYLGTFPKD
ncbi:putative nucleotide-diphospho-sugar transferase [Ruegeria lacuscaerulensis]|uniref:putative nucleotide-diphospho-sugar transferase n=1 Tax=Ruegeria lacuscaerulensis TaxID=55218 RepID=UPI001480A979|nr:putative nucleotide-diphospho-sugar transferase [Ruegeria lacuscaerulensis]